MNAITPSQCRAARALLDWTRAQLAEASGIPERTLADFESATTKPRAATLSRMAHAFANAGVVFVQIPGAATGGGAILIR